MVDAIILMGGMGLAISIILAIASKVFYVYVDPKILSIEEELPGANCGGCGYAGCKAFAEALVQTRDTGLSCPVCDAGATEASRPSRRVGVEWTNFWQLSNRIALDLDPDHKGALEYQGELRLEQNNLPAAEANLAKLRRLCPAGCAERDDLERAIQAYKSTAANPDAPRSSIGFY